MESYKEAVGGVKASAGGFTAAYAAAATDRDTAAACGFSRQRSHQCDDTGVSLADGEVFRRVPER